MRRRPALSLLSLILPLGAVQPLAAQTVYTPYHFITIAGAPGVRGGADGAGPDARFYGPEGLAVDGAGNVYVADTNNDTIRRLTPAVSGGVTTWTVTTLAGTAGASGYVDATGPAARFHQPVGIFIDGGGTVCVDDNQPFVNNVTPINSYDTKTSFSSTTAVLREITPGGVVTTAPTDTPANQVKVCLAAGTYAQAPDGRQFAAQLESSLGGNFTVILEYNGIFPCPSATAILASSGAVTSAQTQAGLLNVLMNGSGYSDGAGGSANETLAMGLAVDGSGNVFVADTGDHLIRKITRTLTGGVESWYVTTLGGVPLVSGSADGTGAAARFNNPIGVAVDAKGNLYISDATNNTIRMGIPDTGPVAGNGTASTTLGRAVTFTLPVTDPFGDPVTCAITGTTGGAATLAGNQATFTPSAAGTGTVSYTASDGYVTSGTGTVTISTVLPKPVITLQAVSQTVAGGRSVAFSAGAAGFPAPAYQWTLNGSTTIPGASVTTDAILLISPATAADAGTLACTATNPAGTATTTATLAVVTDPNPGHLTNVSARGNVGSGSGILIGGFSIAGSGTKTVLVRGIGPGLNYAFAPFPGYVPDTQLGLFLGPNPATTPGGAVIQNAAWGSPGYPGAPDQATLAAAMSALGAYGLQAGSHDTALLVSLGGTAAYTAEVSGVGAETGIGVVEVYDADSAAPAVRLDNLSARSFVGTGGNILFGGFVVGGNTAETVLIRAVGPSLALAPFDLAGVLAQPVLTLYSGNTPIYSNASWGGDPVLAAAEATVGAYALPSNSADSLLLVTLPPGGYSVQVSGANGATGIATVEIYEVP
jgi:Immunoglobulin domain/NHL repeat